MTSDSRCRRVTNSQLGDSRSDRCVIGREEYLLPGRRSRVLVILAVPGPGTREMALVAQGLEGSETSGRERAGGWPLNWKRRPFRYGARTREAAAQYYSTAHARSTTRPMQRPGCGCGCKPDGGGTARPRVVSCNGQYSARTIPRCTKQLAPHPLARFLEWVPSSHSPFAPSALSLPPDNAAKASPLLPSHIFLFFLTFLTPHSAGRSSISHLAREISLFATASTTNHRVERA